MFQSLTGHWIGRYDYPEGRTAVGFEAQIFDESGALTGTILEPNTFRQDMGSELSARLVGSRDTEVRFVKYYMGFSQFDDPVYEGTANPGLTRIKGVWLLRSLPAWTGRFLMVRKPIAGAEANTETAAEETLSS